MHRHAPWCNLLSTGIIVVCLQFPSASLNGSTEFRSVSHPITQQQDVRPPSRTNSVEFKPVQMGSFAAGAALASNNSSEFIVAPVSKDMSFRVDPSPTPTRQVLAWEHPCTEHVRAMSAQ